MEALVKEHNRPRLFVGDAFALTDVTPALSWSSPETAVLQASRSGRSWSMSDSTPARRLHPAIAAARAPAGRGPEQLRAETVNFMNFAAAPRPAQSARDRELRELRPHSSSGIVASSQRSGSTRASHSCVPLIVNGTGRPHSSRAGR